MVQNDKGVHKKAKMKMEAQSTILHRFVETHPVRLVRRAAGSLGSFFWGDIPQDARASLHLPGATASWRLVLRQLVLLVVNLSGLGLLLHYFGVELASLEEEEHPASVKRKHRELEESSDVENTFEVETKTKKWRADRAYLAIQDFIRKMFGSENANHFDENENSFIEGPDTSIWNKTMDMNFSTPKTPSNPGTQSPAFNSAISLTDFVGQGYETANSQSVTNPTLETGFVTSVAETSVCGTAQHLRGEKSDHIGEDNGKGYPEGIKDGKLMETSRVASISLYSLEGESHGKDETLEESEFRGFDSEAEDTDSTCPFKLNQVSDTPKELIQDLLNQVDAEREAVLLESPNILQNTDGSITADEFYSP